MTNTMRWHGSTLTTLTGGGEAHLWAGEHGIVSVDLGYMNTGKRAARAHPRVVILTHSDHDHINGAVPFFAATATARPDCGPLHELWVPYEWSVLVDVFGQVLTGDVSANDVRRTEEFAEPEGLPEGDRTEAVKSPSAGPVRWTESPLLEVKDDESSEGSEVETVAEEDAAKITRALSNGFAMRSIQARRSPSESEIGQIANDITQKAGKLRRILETAGSAGWRIRWFSRDHIVSGELWRSSGEPGMVTICNAQEVRVHRAQASAALLLHAAQLTVQNWRALAPYLWGSGLNGDAVVWSDGDGGGMENLRHFPWRAIGVMSAPHHGSNNTAHEPIWESLSRSGRSPNIIRTGGFSSQTLHPTLGLLPPNRIQSTRAGIGFQKGDAMWHPQAGFIR